MITQTKLKELLHYAPETGVFTWVKATNRRICIGSIAGSVAGYRYRIIRICGKTHSAHRLAWLYIHGEFPEHDIDHINHDRHDNRIINLRSVTRGDNCRNRGYSPRNTSGHIGVVFDKARGCWTSRLFYDGKQVHFMRHEKKADAIKARKKAEKRYGFHENHGSKL